MVLDREFSYREGLAYLQAAGLHFVIRLNQGSQSPIFLNQHGREVELHLRVGESVVYYNLLYRRHVHVNLIGVWRKGHAKPLWVMTDLEPEQGLAIYSAAHENRGELPRPEKPAGPGQDHEQMPGASGAAVALVLLAYSLGSVVGEAVRDVLFPAPVTDAAALPAQPAAGRSGPAAPSPRTLRRAVPAAQVQAHVLAAHAALHRQPGHRRFPGCPGPACPIFCPT